MFKLTEKQKQKVIDLFYEPEEYFSENVLSKDWYACNIDESVDGTSADEYYPISIVCKDSLGKWEELECVTKYFFETDTERISRLIERAKYLEATQMKGNEEVEIGVYEGTVTISKYSPDYESAFHIEDFCEEDEIDIVEMRKALDNEGIGYVV